MSSKNKSHGLLSSKIFALLSLFILIFLGVSLSRELLSNRQLDENVISLKDEMNVLESKNKELGGLISYFNTADFVEQEARTKLNLQKLGERIIIVPSSTEQAVSTDQAKQKTELVWNDVTAGSNPERWLNYFFKH
jgi:cell division protein FtsB